MDGPGVGAEAPEARPSLIGRNEAPFVFQLDAPLQMWGTETRARNAVYTSVGALGRYRDIERGRRQPKGLPQLLVEEMPKLAIGQ